MIVKMKKVVVISLEHHREATLEKLQDIGVLHVQPVEKPVTNNAGTVAGELKKVRSCFIALEEFGDYSTTKKAPVSPEKCVEEVNALEEKRKQLSESLLQLREQIEDLKVWGEFQPERIRDLKNKGIFVKLYRCPKEEVPELPEGCAMRELLRTKTKTAFAVVSREDFLLAIPEVKLPEVSPAELSKRAENLEAEIDKIKTEISGYTSSINKLKDYKQKLEEDFDRAAAEDQLSKVGNLIYLQGFVPEGMVEAIEACAKKEGWALSIEAPSKEDFVPTLIKYPKFIKPIKVVFDFIDTFPGYKERDVSASLEYFYSGFYAMLIGDDGYGVAFFVGTIVVRI